MSNPNQVYLPSFSATTIASTIYSGKEVDMRQEFLNMLFGTAQEVPKAQHGLLRRMRLDDKGVKIKCPCVDKTTHEADRDYYCAICLNERYMWDEYLIDYYLVQPADMNDLASKEVGLIPVGFGIFYLPYNIIINSNDKIAEINLDIEGNIVQPIKRTQIWQFTSVVPLRSDHARLEFIKIFARIEDVRYLNAPGR
jgi:hypothetical protein